jgi:hypothetical protein
MELIKCFSSERYSRALEAWTWLGLEGKVPVFTSLLGDVFFQSETGFWFLDTVDGTITRAWATEDELRGSLRSVAGQDRYLLAGLAEAAARVLGALEAPQVYDFKTPPVLGGQIDVANLGRVDFVVSVNIAGQLHQQVKNRPAGARISGIRVEGPDS